MRPLQVHPKWPVVARTAVKRACLVLSLAALFGPLAPWTPCVAQDEAENQAKAPVKTVKPLSSAKKSRFKDQIRRLLQNSKIAKARKAAEKAIARWEEEKDPKHNDLLAYASWAMAVLAGNDGNKDKCLDYFDRALEAGWANPFTFEYASLVPAEIRHSEAYRSRVQRLRRAFEDEQRRELEARLAQSLDHPLGTLKLPADSGGGTLSQSSLAGRPLVVVITRHDQPGFSKMVPALRGVTERFGEILPVVALFYQYFADDAPRRAETVAFVEKAKVTWPFAIVDRPFVKQLDLDFLPATFLLDGERRILFRETGTLEPSFLEKVFVVGIQATGAKAVKAAAPESPVDTPAAETTDPVSPDEAPDTPEPTEDSPKKTPVEKSDRATDNPESPQETEKEPPVESDADPSESIDDAHAE